MPTIKMEFTSQVEVMAPIMEFAGQTQKILTPYIIYKHCLPQSSLMLIFRALVARLEEDTGHTVNALSNSFPSEASTSLMPPTKPTMTGWWNSLNKCYL